MTHAEFNELMGCTTSAEEYSKANFLYMKAGEMPKQEFVKHYKKIGENPLMKELYESMVQMSNRIYKDDLEADCLRSARQADAKAIINLMEEYGYVQDIYLYMLKSMISHKDAICHKISNGIDLANLDKNYIANNLK